MDKLTAEALERELAKSEARRGGGDSPGPAPPEKPLYVQDLEERAERLGVPVDKLHEQDRQSQSRPQPTRECLRPDDVLRCCNDTNALPHSAWQHLQGCRYCQGLVAVARPDAARHRALLERMADAPEAPPSAAPLVRWTEAFFARLDTGTRRVATGGGALVLCLALVWYISPGVLRPLAPGLASLGLERQARQALQDGNPDKADALATKVIDSQPANPGAYALRSQARQRLGKTDLAEKDLTVVGDIVYMKATDIAPAPPDGDVQADEKRIKEISAVWGSLPQKEREKIIQELSAKLPAKDRAVIDAYMRELKKRAGSK